VASIMEASTAILYSGIMSCGVAYTLQIVAQKYVSPAPATLAMSLESVWAAVGGALLLGEVMSARETIGCVILFIAVVIAQMPDKVKKTSV
ncbi:MAG: EamA family transporter, partial [Spirochaetales bacterium]|nr:EamA family transporter [Spirochaetales bacterium]